MADRSNFWRIVDRTRPSKLRAFTVSELRDCQDYFLEIQSDSTLPPNEIITASERLALIGNEIAIRYSDAKHRQTQRLARWAIAAGMVSLTVAIVFGVAQSFVNRPTRENWPVAIETLTAIETPTVATPTPTASPSPFEKAASPSPAASSTASPKAKPTSKKAKAKRKARLAARTVPGRSTDEAANPPAPGGGHGQVWVNTETGVYHREGSRFYGTTRTGKYMIEQDAIQTGYKPAPKRR
jgi:hypothetical protein